MVFSNGRHGNPIEIYGHNKAEVQGDSDHRTCMEEMTVVVLYDMSPHLARDVQKESSNEGRQIFTD